MKSYLTGLTTIFLTGAMILGFGAIADAQRDSQQPEENPRESWPRQRPHPIVRVADLNPFRQLLVDQVLPDTLRELAVPPAIDLPQAEYPNLHHSIQG